jgi:hypothetical protein
LEGSNLGESGDDARVPIAAAGRLDPLSARRDPCAVRDVRRRFLGAYAGGRSSLPYNQFPLAVPIKITACAGHLHAAAGPDQDQVAHATAAIGLTIEPHSQIGHSFTFRGFGLRLVVTKTPSGIDVTGASSLIDRLAKELGATPHKNA